MTIAKRLVSFIEKIKKCEKSVLRSNLSVIKSDVRTVTGRNLRSILRLCDKSTVQQLCQSDTVLYHGELDQWRVMAIIEAIKVGAGEMALPEGWSGKRSWRRPAADDHGIIILIS